MPETIFPKGGLTVEQESWVRIRGTKMADMYEAATQETTSLMDYAEASPEVYLKETGEPPPHGLWFAVETAFLCVLGERQAQASRQMT